MRQNGGNKSLCNLLFMKVAFVLCLLFMISQPFIGTNIAHAEYTPIISEDDLEPENKPGLVEKHLSKFVLNIANTLISIAQAQDVSTLVFQRDDVIKSNETWVENKANASREDMMFGIFPSGLFDGIAVFYDLFISLLTVPIIVIFVLGGLLLMFDLLRSHESKRSVKEVILGVIVAILLIRFGHIAWDWIVFLNYIIVDGIYLALKANGINVTSFISTIWDPSATDSVTKAPSFTIALIVICAVAFTLTMNYQYMMRMIILSMLVILFPFVILSCIVPSKRAVLNTWFTEFTSQVFIQAAHAIALGIFFFSLTKASSLGFWFVMTMFFALPAISDVVQRIVSGFTGEGGGGGGFKTSMQNGSGVGSLKAVANIGKGVMGGKGKGASTSGNGLASNASGLSTGGSSGISTGGSSAIGTSNMGAGVGSAPISSSGQGAKSRIGTSGGGAGVGSAPIASNGQGGKSRPRGVARFGSGVAKAGKKLATSQGLRRGATAALAISAATVGAVAGTMTTGKATNGLVAGAAVGTGVGRVAGVTASKIGKGTQVAGEVIQSRAQGGGSLNLTKERLGYHDSSQFSDPSEMKRMGSELLGGSAGSVVGKAVGSASYYTDRFAQKGSDLAKNRYDAVNEKRDLSWNENQQAQRVEQLGNDREISKIKLDAVQAIHGGPQKDVKNQHPEVVKAQQEYQEVDAKYKVGKHQQVQAQQQSQNYYAIKSHANQTKNLQNQRASSGAL